MVIFYFSAQPDLPHAPLVLLDLLLRKGSHMAEYALRAVLVQRALAPSAASLAGGRITLAWLVAVLYAVSDEWHQSFVPGRKAAATDVAIDGIGALLGLLGWRLALRRLAASKQPTAAAVDTAQV